MDLHSYEQIKLQFLPIIIKPNYINSNLCIIR